MSDSGLQVIGAGFGRTGTMSLYTALNQLGFKTHHMKEVIGDSTGKQFDLWSKVFYEHDNDITPFIDDIYDGFTATGELVCDSPTDATLRSAHNSSTVDFPGAIYYKELLQRYPDAKVILTSE